jgi:hypothetical protein
VLGKAAGDPFWLRPGIEADGVYLPPELLDELEEARILGRHVDGIVKPVVGPHQRPDLFPADLPLVTRLHRLRLLDLLPTDALARQPGGQGLQIDPHGIDVFHLSG